MAQEKKAVNLGGKAPLYNVAQCLAALQKGINRPAHLPGLLVFYGPSGFGKSSAAAAAVTQTGAYYVQAQSSWTRKALHLSILKVMGIAPAKTLYEMGDQIATQLIASRRALIIDEADHLVNKGIIECVRDFYEASLAPIMLIGEENLPGNLKKWERIHGRVLEFTPAQPASEADAKALRDMYAKKVSIADDLLQKVLDEANGSVRRIIVNLELIQNTAMAETRDTMDLAAWGERRLYTGDAPARRVSA